MADEMVEAGRTPRRASHHALGGPSSIPDGLISNQ